METPEISVIVPVYKVEKYLHRCVDSILNQTFTDLEIILVDDGSPDRCGEICDEYARKDSRVRVIHKENGGLSDARNVGIDISRGKYIGFVDSDDYIEKDMYEYLYSIITKESADVAMCEIFDCFAGKDITHHECGYYDVTDSVGAIACVLEGKFATVNAVNKLFKKELFDHLYFKVGKTMEDAFIIVDLLANAQCVVITNCQKYYYFHRDDSITTKSFNKSDLDLIDAYEYNYRRAMEISPTLEEPAILRRCWSRFCILDKMMVSDGNYDYQIEKECIAFLKSYQSFIFRNKVFTRNRKVAFGALLISPSLYRKIVRFNTKKNKSAHS